MPLNITNARMRCLLLAAEVTRLGTIRVDTDEDDGHGHFSCLKRHKAFAHTPSNNQCMRLPSNGARAPPCSSTAQLPLLRSCDFWYHFGTILVPRWSLFAFDETCKAFALIKYTFASYQWEIHYFTLDKRQHQLVGSKLHSACNAK